MSEHGVEADGDVRKVTLVLDSWKVYDLVDVLESGIKRASIQRAYYQERDEEKPGNLTGFYLESAIRQIEIGELVVNTLKDAIVRNGITEALEAEHARMINEIRGDLAD